MTLLNKIRLPTWNDIGMEPVRYDHGRKEKMTGAVTMIKLMKSYQRDFDEHRQPCVLVPLSYIDDLITKLENINRTL